MTNQHNQYLTKESSDSYLSQAVRVAVLLAGYGEVQSYRNLSCYNYLKTRLQQSSKIVRRFSLLIASALAEPIPWIIAVSLGSCTSNALSTNAGSSQKQLQVMTTFIPITDFTKAVAGNRAQVTQLLPTNVDPHDYQAKPEDAHKLAKADVLVENGLEMEGFLKDLVKNAGNAKLKVIDSSLGIQTISTETIEGKKPSKAGQERTAFNPHIWLDPKRAIHQVENIRDGLISADPPGKEIYSNNAAAYIQRLQELDAETTKMLQPFGGKTFVAFHDFAPYFAKSYNLKANFLVDVPEDNPSPDDVKRIVDTVKATNLKTLLAEPQGGEDAFAALAKDLNVRVSTFDSMETGGSDALQPDHYITTMRQNVKTLKTAFTGRSTQSFLPLWTREQLVGVRF
jgi:zinc transport system substrate-binding protein